MSKKTKQKAQAREEQKRSIKADIAGGHKSAKSTPPARSTSRSTQGAVRAYDRPGRAVQAAKMDARSVLIARIAALVIAAAALAGGIYWSLNVDNTFSAGVIIGLLALGILAGLGIFTAMRPEVVLKRALSITRR